MFTEQQEWIWDRHRNDFLITRITGTGWTAGFLNAQGYTRALQLLVRCPYSHTLIYQVVTAQLLCLSFLQVGWNLRPDQGSLQSTVEEGNLFYSSRFCGPWVCGK